MRLGVCQCTEYRHKNLLHLVVFTLIFSAYHGYKINLSVYIAHPRRESGPADALAALSLTHTRLLPLLARTHAEALGPRHAALQCAVLGMLERVHVAAQSESMRRVVRAPDLVFFLDY